MHHVLNNTSSPTLQTFNDIAIPIGVIESNIADPQPWILSNFISLHYKLTWTQYTFSLKPFYRWDCFDSRNFWIISSSMQHFISVIRNSISGNQYIYTFVDEYYMPYSYAYQKIHFCHDLCIYGFDDSKQVFHISAYDSYNRYTLLTVSFDTLYLAFRCQKHKRNWMRRLVAFNLKPDFPFHKYDNRRIRNGIYHYFASSVSGINIYSFIEYQIKRQIRKDKEVDLHYFQILMEHMRIVAHLDSYDIDYLDNYIQSRKICLMALKYSMTRDPILFSKILAELKQLKRDELKALEPYIKSNFKGLPLRIFYRKYHSAIS